MSAERWRLGIATDDSDGAGTRPPDLIRAYTAPAVAADPDAAPATPYAQAERAAAEPRGLGWVPALAVTTAFGLLVLAVGDALSRATISSSQVPFWAGLLLIYIPITFRVASAKVGRNEGLALVLLLGLSLYLVKVFFAPFGFTFGDELAHEPNANIILHTHQLFHPTSILPVTAYYPGLESVTAALASLSGLTTFGAGLIVIGLGRVMTMLALYLLFERLSGSTRIAGIGAVVYAANANFVFFDAQFAYESLALPLLLAALATVAEWRRATVRRNWSIVALLLTVAIVVTHHVTSYALAGFLIALCVVYGLIARDRIDDAPVSLAAVAVAAIVVWVGTVARATVGYLWPVLHGAITSAVQTLQGQKAPRQLFASTGYQPPVLERVIGILSVLLLFAGFVAGLRALWRSHRQDPFVVVLGAAAVAFFALELGRLAPAAWETANRSSEFVFVGLAFVVAMVGIDGWFPRRPRAFATAFAAGLLAIVFAGGVISGWTPQLRLAQPYQVKVDGRTIDSESRQLARFAAAHYPGTRFATSEADASLLATYARVYAISGRNPDVYDILRSSDFVSWHEALLRKLRIQFLAVDRRQRSFDNLAGYYFGVREPFGQPDVLLPASVFHNFESIGVAKPYDSGNIAIFIHPLPGRRGRP
jgi:hypothetical protein